VAMPMRRQLHAEREEPSRIEPRRGDVRRLHRSRIEEQRMIIGLSGHAQSGKDTALEAKR